MAALHVWMNGQHVGVWTASRGGVPLFRYDPAWTQAPLARALSLSLPMTAGAGEHRGDVVAHYFENLLPDSADVRKRLGARFKTRSASAFDLLAAIGRDCVGAVQLLPEGMEPQGWNRVEASPLNEEQVERFLKNATTAAPLGQRVEDGEDEDFRISIAGAQEKTALLHFGGAWHRPLGATPTTHILKLPLGRVGNMQADMSNSVENEWLCAQIVRELGLPVARVAMARFGGQRARGGALRPALARRGARGPGRTGLLATPLGMGGEAASGGSVPSHRNLPQPQVRSRRGPLHAHLPGGVGRQ